MPKERKKPEKQYLVLVGMGESNPGLLNEFTHLISIAGCSVIDCRVGRLANHLTLMALLCGSWNQIAKIENKLPTLEKSHGFRFFMQRSNGKAVSENTLPYAIYVVGLEQSGVVHKLTDFFSFQDIQILELTTHTYIAKHTNSTMFSLHMQISVPIDIHIADLRDRFMLFCDDLNLDAIMEPEKY